MYATLWRRLAAALIDGAIVTVIGLVIGFIIYSPFECYVHSKVDSSPVLRHFGHCLGGAVGVALTSLLESSFVGVGLLHGYLLSGAHIEPLLPPMAPGCFLIFIVNWVYHAGMESSAKQATFGKLLMRIRVSHNERAPSFVRASVRHFGKFLSTVFVFMGYLMAALTKKKQALHDKLADCVVLVGEAAK